LYCTHSCRGEKETNEKPNKKKHNALLLVDGIYEPMDRWRIRANIRVPCESSQHGHTRKPGTKKTVPTKPIKEVGDDRSGSVLS
jgi:hypothetical protein